MSRSATPRLILAALPGTVLDVVTRTRMPEASVRARVAELQRAGLARKIGRKPSGWCVYATCSA